MPIKFRSVPIHDFNILASGDQPGTVSTEMPSEADVTFDPRTFSTIALEFQLEGRPQRLRIVLSPPDAHQLGRALRQAVKNYLRYIPEETDA